MTTANNRDQSTFGSTQQRRPRSSFEPKQRRAKLAVQRNTSVSRCVMQKILSAKRKTSAQPAWRASCEQKKNPETKITKTRATTITSLSNPHTRAHARQSICQQCARQPRSQTRTTNCHQKQNGRVPSSVALARRTHNPSPTGARDNDGVSARQYTGAATPMTRLSIADRPS